LFSSSRCAATRPHYRSLVLLIVALVLLSAPVTINCTLIK
jgi:hypothetical protein